MSVRQSMFSEGHQEDLYASLQPQSCPKFSGNALYIQDAQGFCLFSRVISGSYRFEI